MKARSWSPDREEEPATPTSLWAEKLLKDFWADLVNGHILAPAAKFPGDLVRRSFLIIDEPEDRLASKAGSRGRREGRHPPHLSLLLCERTCVYASPIDISAPRAESTDPPVGFAARSSRPDWRRGAQEPRSWWRFRTNVLRRPLGSGSPRTGKSSGETGAWCPPARGDPPGEATAGRGPGGPGAKALDEVTARPGVNTWWWPVAGAGEGKGRCTLASAARPAWRRPGERR